MDTYKQERKPMVSNRKEHPTITPAQFTRRRQKLFPSPTKAARAMGVTTRAIAYWESGERRIPLMAVILLRYMERDMMTTSECVNSPDQKTGS
jgi:DNA-binding transcriptional regulator YiaG